MSLCACVRACVRACVSVCLYVCEPGYLTQKPRSRERGRKHAVEGKIGERLMEKDEQSEGEFNFAMSKRERDK